MAVSFAGGTDRAAWTVPAVPPTNGCVAFMLKTTQTTVNACPFSYWSGTSRNGWGFVLNNTLNKILAQGMNTTSTPSIQLVSTTSVNDGNWHHVAFSYARNSGSNALYIDGASEATGNTSPSWNTGANNFVMCLGDNVDTFWPSYVGEIAQIGHWGAQLDAAEVAALAKGYSPKLIRPTSLLFHAPCVREMREIRAGLAATLTGTSITNHPRTIGEGG